MRRKGRAISGGTFATVIQAYLHSNKFDQLEPSTRYRYTRYLTLAQMPETLGAVPIDTIRPALVQHFLDGLAEWPGVQKNARVALKSLEKWALVRDLLPFPITTGCEVVGSDGGHKPWSDEQIELVERHASQSVARAVILAANTGQRGSDLIKMRWSDIEEVDGTPGINVVQQKTGRRLWVPMTAALRNAVSSWEKAPTYLLLDRYGKPFPYRQALSDAWLAERDGNEALAPCEGLKLHGLRSTAVVRLRRLGATTMQISDMIGMSAAMVERYSRFADQRQSAMAAVVRLDQHRARTNLTIVRKDETG
jgi:integrase